MKRFEEGSSSVWVDIAYSVFWSHVLDILCTFSDMHLLPPERTNIAKISREIYSWSLDQSFHNIFCNQVLPGGECRWQAFEAHFSAGHSPATQSPLHNLHWPVSSLQCKLHCTSLIGTALYSLRIKALACYISAIWLSATLCNWARCNSMQLPAFHSGVHHNSRQHYLNKFVCTFCKLNKYILQFEQIYL